MSTEDGARFKKGDKVRCINAKDGCGFLVEGNVYEVYSVRPDEGLTISRTSAMWEESQFEPASQPPAWAEELAKEWEEKARRSAQGQCAEPTWADVATKLRERAR